jgi:hypothetical protein
MIKKILYSRDFGELPSGLKIPTGTTEPVRKLRLPVWSSFGSGRLANDLNSKLELELKKMKILKNLKNTSRCVESNGVIFCSNIHSFSILCECPQKY